MTKSRADSYDNRQSYETGCAYRAIVEGHRALIQPDASFRVISETDPDERWIVRYVAAGCAPWDIRFSCDCPSGVNRAHLPIPCKHAWLAGRNLFNRCVAIVEGEEFVVAPDWRPTNLCSSCRGALRHDQANGDVCDVCKSVFGEKASQ